MTCRDARLLTAITSDQLNTITGTFGLYGLTIMSTLQFDSLTDVSSIHWDCLPALQGLNFAKGVSKLKYIYINNAQLNSLSGFAPTTLTSIEGDNNPYLANVNLNGVKNIKWATFSINAANLVVSFADLEEGEDFGFNDMGGLSRPSLPKGSGSMGISRNLLESLDMAALTGIGGTLEVADSPFLSTLSFSLLVAGWWRVVHREEHQARRD